MLLIGIWASSDEDDDDDKKGRSKYSSGRGKKDYVTPVSFVSGGVKVGDKVTKEDQDEDDEMMVRISEISKD